MRTAIIALVACGSRREVVIVPLPVPIVITVPATSPPPDSLPDDGFITRTVTAAVHHDACPSREPLVLYVDQVRSPDEADRIDGAAACRALLAEPGGPRARRFRARISIHAAGQVPDVTDTPMDQVRYRTWYLEKLVSLEPA